jgi:hypothetical protein
VIALRKDRTAAVGPGDVFATAGNEEGDDDAQRRDDDVAKGGDAQAIRRDGGLRPMRGERPELL